MYSSNFSIYGYNNSKMAENKSISQTNFHARLMHILNKDLKFNYPLDMHFLEKFKEANVQDEEELMEPEHVKLLDEKAGFNYREVLIDETRNWYQ